MLLLTDPVQLCFCAHFRVLLKEKVRKVIGLTSDGEEIYQTLTEDDETDDYSDLDDAERERQRIGKKKRALFTVSVVLNLVLVEATRLLVL